jgi:hypothetical protein
MQQPPYQPQQPGPAPAKKSGNGCLIVLAVIGGLVLVVVAVISFGVYRFASSKEGKAVFGVLGDMTKVMAEAQSAPGAAEVRALGCDQAMVMDFEKMGSLFELLDASAPSNDLSVMIVCQVGVMHAGTVPKCDDIAHTYVRAVKTPPRAFAVTVNHGSGTTAQACSAQYDPRGTKVRDLAPGSTPRLPTK